MVRQSFRGDEKAMIYTTGWTREKVRTEGDYQRWLESLNDRDEVLLQQFHPAAGDNAVLDVVHETWEFERVWLLGDQLHSRGNSHPIIRATGKACYWGSDKEWGKVFPARLVPMSSDLCPDKTGRSIFAHHPVYEPLFLGCYRHHAIARYGPKHKLRFNHGFERYYWRDVEGGSLLVFFSDKEAEDIQLPDGLQYLYSEFINR
jgi:hypothetical protein